MKIPGVEKRSVQSLGRVNEQQALIEANQGNDLYNGAVNTFNRLYKEESKKQSDKASIDVGAKLDKIINGFSDSPTEWTYQEVEEKINDVVKSSTNDETITPAARGELNAQAYALGQKALGMADVVSKDYLKTVREMDMQRKFLGSSKKAEDILRYAEDNGFSVDGDPILPGRPEKKSIMGYIEEYRASLDKYKKDHWAEGMTREEILYFDKLGLQTEGLLYSQLDAVLTKKQQNKTERIAGMKLSSILSPVWEKTDAEYLRTADDNGGIHGSDNIANYVEINNEILTAIDNQHKGVLSNSELLPNELIQNIVLGTTLEKMNLILTSVNSEYMQKAINARRTQVMANAAKWRGEAAALVDEANKKVMIKDLRQAVTDGRSIDAVVLTKELIDTSPGVYTKDQQLTMEYAATSANELREVKDILFHYKMGKINDLPPEMTRLYLEGDYDGYKKGDDYRTGGTLNEDDWNTMALDMYTAQSEYENSIEDLGKQNSGVQDKISATYLQTVGNGFPADPNKAASTRATLKAISNHPDESDSNKVNANLKLSVFNIITPNNGQPIDIQREMLMGKVRAGRADGTRDERILSSIQAEGTRQLDIRAKLLRENTVEYAENLYGEHTGVITSFIPDPEDSGAGGEFALLIQSRKKLNNKLNTQMKRPPSAQTSLLKPGEVETLQLQVTEALLSDNPSALISIVGHINTPVGDNPGASTSIWNQIDGIDEGFLAFARMDLSFSAGGIYSNPEEISLDAVDAGIDPIYPVQERQTALRQAYAQGIIKQRSEFPPDTRVKSNRMEDRITGEPKIITQLEAVSRRVEAIYGSNFSPAQKDGLIKMVDTVSTGLVGGSATGHIPASGKGRDQMHIDKALKLSLGPIIEGPGGSLTIAPHKSVETYGQMKKWFGRNKLPGEIPSNNPEGTYKLVMDGKLIISPLPELSDNGMQEYVLKGLPDKNGLAPATVYDPKTDRPWAFTLEGTPELGLEDRWNRWIDTRGPLWMD